MFSTFLVDCMFAYLPHPATTQRQHYFCWRPDQYGDSAEWPGCDWLAAAFGVLPSAAVSHVRCAVRHRDRTILDTDWPHASACTTVRAVPVKNAPMVRLELADRSRAVLAVMLEHLSPLQALCSRIGQHLAIIDRLRIETYSVSYYELADMHTRCVGTRDFAEQAQFLFDQYQIEAQQASGWCDRNCALPLEQAG